MVPKGALVNDVTQLMGGGTHFCDTRFKGVSKNPTKLDRGKRGVKKSPAVHDVICEWSVSTSDSSDKSESI